MLGTTDKTANNIVGVDATCFKSLSQDRLDISFVVLSSRFQLKAKLARHVRA